MLGWVPAGAREPIISAGALGQPVLGLHAAPCDFIGQIGHAQLHRGDLRQAQVLFVERRGDDAEAGHQPVEIYLAPMGPAEQAFEIGSPAHGIAARVALDQRRAPEEQPVLRAARPRPRSPPSLKRQT
jgi:hypothetical protein